MGFGVVVVVGSGVDVYTPILHMEEERLREIQGQSLWLGEQGREPWQSDLWAALKIPPEEPSFSTTGLVHTPWY